MTICSNFNSPSKYYFALIIKEHFDAILTQTTIDKSKNLIYCLSFKAHMYFWSYDVKKPSYYNDAVDRNTFTVQAFSTIICQKKKQKKNLRKIASSESGNFLS